MVVSLHNNPTEGLIGKHIHFGEFLAHWNGCFCFLQFLPGQSPAINMHCRFGCKPFVSHPVCFLLTPPIYRCSYLRPHIDTSDNLCVFITSLDQCLQESEVFLINGNGCPTELLYQVSLLGVKIIVGRIPAINQFANVHSVQICSTRFVYAYGIIRNNHIIDKTVIYGVINMNTVL